jgi:streptogramin lyase
MKQFIGGTCILLLWAALAGCFSGPETEDIGTAEVAIAQTPADVRCLRITVTGTRSSVRSIDVATGDSTAALTLGGLSLGANTFSGEAFSDACSAITSSSVAAWVAAPVAVAVVAGVKASVSLVMKRNGQADVSVDFQDDGPPPGTITEFAVTSFSGGPNWITSGPDGNLWFTGEPGTIKRITPAGVVTPFAIPSGTNADGITAGPDGNLWFCESGVDKIGRITPSGQTTEITIPGGNPCDTITPRAEDGLLWFTVHSGYSVGTVTTGGAVDTLVLSDGGQPAGILAASGKVWIIDPNYGRLESFTSLSADSRALYNVGDNPSGEMARGSDGAIYILASSKILKFSTTTNTVVGRFTVPTVDPGAFSITAGADGHLWFTESYANKLGRLQTDGTIDEYDVAPFNVGLGHITTGPDGNLWFTETLGHAIGRMVPP